MTVDCPRCDKPCPIGPHQSAHCARCFTSWRVTAQSLLTTCPRPGCGQMTPAYEAIVPRPGVEQIGEVCIDGVWYWRITPRPCDSCRAADRAEQGQAVKLFEPAPNQIPGQLSL